MVALKWWLRSCFEQVNENVKWPSKIKIQNFSAKAKKEKTQVQNKSKFIHAVFLLTH